MDNLLVLALGMSVVTMIPRIIPLFWLQADKLSPGVQNFFKCLPTAMLTALVVPGVASASGSLGLSLAGAATAVILSLLKIGPTGTVVGSVGMLYLLQTTGVLK